MTTWDSPFFIQTSGDSIWVGLFVLCLYLAQTSRDSAWDGLFLLCLYLAQTSSDSIWHGSFFIFFTCVYLAQTSDSYVWDSSVIFSLSVFSQRQVATIWDGSFPPPPFRLYSAQTSGKSIRDGPFQFFFLCLMRGPVNCTLCVQ